MARARNIKPGFFSNEDLADCSFETRLLFIGLWTLADRDGRLEDRPKRIKASVFPYDNVDIDACLSDLESRGFIVRYASDCGDCISIANFVKHQNPHHKEIPSILPSPPKNGQPCGKHKSSMNQPCVNEIVPCALVTDSGFLVTDSLNLNPDSPNGESSTEPQAAAVLTFPVRGKVKGKPVHEWPLTEAKLAEYAETFPDFDVLAECRKALQWCRDNPGKRKTPRGMAAFLSRWLTSAIDRGGGQRAGPPAHKPRVPTDEDLANWNPVTGNE